VAVANLKQASNYRSALAGRYQAQPAVGGFKHPTLARLARLGAGQASAHWRKKTAEPTALSRWAPYIG
jgi:hypothetical protein